MSAIELGRSILPDDIDPEILVPIDGDPTNKDLLSMSQLTAEDIHKTYFPEAAAAAAVLEREDPAQRWAPLLSGVVLNALMRQESTRTGGSMVTAMEKLGGSAHLISGAKGSAEAKGESRLDSELAIALLGDIYATRTAEEWAPARTAQLLRKAARRKDIRHDVPVINLGDGRNEHVTQALGDLYTMDGDFGQLEGVILAVVGDHERYRAHHSLIIGALLTGMEVIAVESPAAPVPEHLVKMGGKRLTRMTDLDEAMRVANALYMGRNPGEYKGRSRAEKRRSKRLARAYGEWVVDAERLDSFREDGRVYHPRPHGSELHSSTDGHPRMGDVREMDNLVPMRMAIIALHLGKSIAEYVEAEKRMMPDAVASVPAVA